VTHAVASSTPPLVTCSRVGEWWLRRCRVRSWSDRSGRDSRALVCVDVTGIVRCARVFALLPGFRPGSCHGLRSRGHQAEGQPFSILRAARHLVRVDLLANVTAVLNLLAIRVCLGPFSVGHQHVTKRGADQTMGQCTRNDGKVTPDPRTVGRGRPRSSAPDTAVGGVGSPLVGSRCGVAGDKSALN